MIARVVRGGVLALALLAAACAGGAARDRALPMPMAGAFTGVAADIERGAAADSSLNDAARAEVAADVVRVREALAAGNRAALLGINWGRLEQLARDGVTARAVAGEIGPGVAASLLERIRLFSEAWQRATDGR